MHARQDHTLELKPSPLTFVRNVLLIELTFALGPIVLFALTTSPEDAYNALQLSQRVSYPLLVALIVALLQALAVIAAFVLWYGRSYRIDRQEVVFRGGVLFGQRHLLPTQSIARIEVEQGRFGRMFDAGTLVLRRSDSAESVRLKHIPSPQYSARQITSLLEPRDEAQVAKAQSVAEMIVAGEGQYVEFKASFLWDYRRQAVNKELNVPTMKNVAAYMNAAGGVLLIGVDDEGEVLGLAPDLQSIKKPNLDGYENVLNMAFNRMIGAEFRQYLEITFPELDGEPIALLSVRPSAMPVFLQHKGKESFYVRTGNSSQPLEMSQAVRYIQTRFSAE